MTHPDISALTLDAIRDNCDNLGGAVRRTPMVPVDTPMTRAVLGDTKVFLKLECLQHTGTFKARGALSVARRLDAAQREKGITAASAGNHAIAAAWAARQIGASAKVVIQSNANPFRVAIAKAEGAEVVMKPPGAETFNEADRLVKEEGRFFIHPFEGFYTSLGTAGVGYEMMTDQPDLDAVIVSVGGGGLISGIATAVKAMRPGCQVIGVEPTGANSMGQSMERGAPVTLDQISTVADSLGAPMALPFSYALCEAHVDRMITLDDDAICAGLVAFQQEAKLAVEPAAGAALAALLGPLRDELRGKRVGIVVCGANLDAGNYQRFSERGQPALEELIA